MTDLVLNSLLFMPLGVGLALSGVRARTAIVIAAFGSGAIELCQIWVVVGRDPSIHDVITNTLGGWLGAMLVVRWGSRARWWPFLAPVVAAAVVSWWVFVAFAVRPVIPGRSHWFAQWAHQFEGTSPLGGEVLSLTLQGHSIPDGPIEPMPAADTVRLALTVVAGRSAPGRAQAAGVVTGQPADDYMSVWVEGLDLIAYQRLSLSAADHPGVWLRLKDAMPPAGDTVRITLTTTPDRIRLAADSHGRQAESALRLAPDLYWGALFLTGDRGIERIRWWWLLPGMLSFVGLGLALNRMPLLLAAAAVALTLGPITSGTALPSWPAAGLALLGVLGGRVLAKRLGLSVPR